ncbi:hypothetical protein [Streptomyces subrutilus]|uniref:hypothetical protein n=1 Tax=Streptomyces subrutilus TaxID=36818 RepID=UPI003411304C
MRQPHSATEYDDVGRALLVSIQVVPEAARFPPVFNAEFRRPARGLGTARAAPAALSISNPRCS